MGNFMSEAEEPRRPSEEQNRSRRPHITSLPTQELLCHLEKEFGSLFGTIQNLKRGGNFDQGTRDYIFAIMQETTNKLQEFSMNKGEVIQTQKAKQDKIQREHFKQQNEIQQLKIKIKGLREDNSLLKKQNKYLDDIITAPPKQSSGSQLVKSFTSGMPNVERKKLDVPLASVQDKLKGISKDAKEKKEIEKIRHFEQVIERDAQIIDELQRANGSLQSYNDILKKDYKDMEEKFRQISEEKNNLMTRLSKMAGQRLVQDNPAIADLSDPNRPTKLGEIYSEIYDNEWTDALEGLLDAGYEEVEAIMTLKLTLMNVIDFCQRKSDKLLKKTEEAMNFLFEELKDIEKRKKHLTMRRSLSEQLLKEVSLYGFSGVDIDLREKWKSRDKGKNPQTYTQSHIEVTKPDVSVGQLKLFRKEVAESMVPIVQKAYMAASSWNDSRFIPALKPFIKKCIFLGWMMVVQSPPLALAVCHPEEEFDKNLYKEYTTRGPKVSYEVWPALLLHEKGPVIGKGIAQAQKA
ncbi:uncharacterized protein LOC123557873 [Mercenaria mercenaria]|uniref:uncharacterized protein LOC123557873 n=1 Tax=Mercenaria mercenaria TaxID=6596 RepID=UPI00234F6E6D|nr:uncharacterized protein LOC123557873 [Mercenaria mercenaria]XP_045205551.2 uncharacterized protein LOC123557873 [Mercenaria mercenaria]